MADIYVLAPYLVHAELSVREEKAFGRWPDRTYHPTPFRDLHGIIFKDGDIVMVRGLRANQSVARMKSFTMDMITQAMYFNLVPVLIGLDNYEMRTRNLVVDLSDAFNKIYEGTHRGKDLPLEIPKIPRE